MEPPSPVPAASWFPPGIVRWFARPVVLDTTDVGFLIDKAWRLRPANPDGPTNGVVEVMPAGPQDAVPFLTQIAGITSGGPRNVLPVARAALLEAGSHAVR